jgi:outer membrane protein assembly factor BamD
MKMILKKSLVLSLLALVLSLLPSCNSEFNKIKKSNDYAYKLEMAIKFYDKGDYTKAQILFEELQNVYKGTEKAETVYFYNAYTNFEMGDYLLAGFLFRNYVRTFPTGKRAEECAYMTAYCYYLNSPEYALDQTDTYAAMREFSFFLKQYPKSERINDCNEYMDKLHNKLEFKDYSTCVQYYHLSDYKAAIADIAIHNKDFPDNKHKEELVFLTVKAYYELGLLSNDKKKAERMKLTMDNYVKFVDAYPKSIYLAEAQTIFESATQIKAQLEKEMAQKQQDKDKAAKKESNKP